MVNNSQNWINKKYPNKEEVTEIYIDKKDLEGELDLTDFTKLEKIYISHFYIDEEENKIKLEIKDKDKYESENKIIKLVNAQKWLESNYDILEENLDLNNKNLEGDLDLKEFTELENLTIIDNPCLGKIKNVNSEATVIRWKNIQEWFNKEYFDKDEITKIDFTNLDTELKKLEFSEPGELEIKGFSNLTNITKGEREFLKVTKITINSCPKLKEINVNYFKENEELILKDNLPNLTELYCSSSKLTKLDVSNCPKIEKLYCHDNLLTNIKLPNETKNLKELALLNNNLKRSAYLNENLSLELSKRGIISYDKDLSFLKNYTNLKKLYLGNFTSHEEDYLQNYDETKKEKGIYNLFNGSLKYLKELKGLEVLDISNTNIDSGLRHLSWKEGNVEKGVKEIYCSSKERPESKVKKIEIELERGKSTFAPLSNRFIRKSKAQQWLDENYPENDTCKNKYDLDNYNKKTKVSKRRGDITKLDIKEWGLTGELNLSDFEQLKELDCSNNQINVLDLSKNDKLVKINCSVNNLKKIDLSNNKELTTLNCSSNNLDSLDLKEIKELKELNCNDNSLTEFRNLSLNPNNLTTLNISNNNFSELRLSVFDKFTRLEKLCLGNTKQDKKNSQFRGSLKYLKNLTKLKELDISNTDIDSGLEYLPKDFQKLYCDPKTERKSTKFAQVFSKYSTANESGDEHYDIAWWRKDKKNLLLRSDDIQKDIRRVFDRRRYDDINNLEDPKELKKEGNKLDTVRSVGRGVSITTGALSFAGGALSLNNLSLVGGGIAVLYPLIEMRFIEEWEKQYTEKKEKWDEFAKDTKRLWHDYRDLVDILRPFEVYANFSDENDKNLKFLWDKFEKILENGNNIKTTKEQFDKELKEKWKDKKWQWKGIEEKLVEITGKVAEIEELNNQQQPMVNNKDKEVNETNALIEVKVHNNPNYGSTGTSK